MTKYCAISKELERAVSLGRATRCNADIYAVDGGISPAVLAEICRLRKESYEGVGVELDDGTMGSNADRDGTYRQLIVWDRERGEIMGGYRYAVGRDVGAERLSLSRYMVLSDAIVKEYLPRGDTAFFDRFFDRQ